MKYIDSDSSLVKDVAKELTFGKNSDMEKLESIFYYVRDKVKFAFLKEADFLTASQVIKRGEGQCNNKSILFQALNQAAGLESRIHFSTIKKSIHFGLFKGLVYLLMPKEISHSWIEVKIDGQWKGIDTYINDYDFFNGSKKMLKKLGVETGLSVSCAVGEASADFNIDGSKYSQMGAVVKSQGTYMEANDYFTSGEHKNNPGKLKMFIYRLHVEGINRRIRELREFGRK